MSTGPQGLIRPSLRLAALLLAILPLGAFGGGATLGLPQHSAEPIRTVVELFTSQGCSSCPPADELLQSLASRPDVLALSLPVDYWDYIGWKDTHASPKNTARQRAYAASIGFNQLYTPQAIVNGAAFAVGSSKTEIEQAIARTSQTFAARRIPITFENKGDVLKISTGTPAPGVEIGQSTIWLVVMRRKADVVIKGGENKGRTLGYTNVVHEMVPVGVWERDMGANITIAASNYLIEPEQDDIAVLLQEGEAGPIVGAAWLKQ